MTVRSTFAGLLALDKPVGVTSHDAVLKVRRRLKSPGAGHLGTLDPGASGLLMVAMGAATRAISVWQGGDKTYEGRAQFGIVTASQDLQGEVVERHATEGLSEAKIREAAARFVGEITQIPPMVSALKVRGERLHRLARRGITVERQPRRAQVIAWEWLDFDLPEASFRVRCSGGTYVRTLVHDLGRALGVGAALAALRRTRSEPFGLDRAVPLAGLDERLPEEVLAEAISLDDALRVLPEVCLDERSAVEVGMGARPVIEHRGAPLSGGPRSVVMRDPEGRALALGELARLPESGLALACPHVVFPWAVRIGRRARNPELPWDAVSALE
jgi:tRNA pseudouridine55 synthase